MQVKNNYKLEWKITNAKGFPSKRDWVFSMEIWVSLSRLIHILNALRLVFDENREAELPILKFR